jgi:hypothetical protein
LKQQGFSYKSKVYFQQYYDVDTIIINVLQKQHNITLRSTMCIYIPGIVIAKNPKLRGIKL